MATNTIITIDRTVGDILTPIAATLKQKNAAGVLAARDLTDHTVKFRMVDEDGTVKVNDQAATVSDATNGKVQYDFLAADVDTAGTYFGWFIVLDGSSQPDTHPVDGATYVIVIHPQNATD